jgi:hypothetical protein
LPLGVAKKHGVSRRSTSRPHPFGGLRSLPIAFVGSRGLLYSKREGDIVYRDFASGLETPVAIGTP